MDKRRYSIIFFFPVSKAIFQQRLVRPNLIGQHLTAEPALLRLLLILRPFRKAKLCKQLLCGDEMLILLPHCNYSSFSLPSTVTVITCHGINLPLCCNAVFAAYSNPPQQGTSMRTTVTLLMSLLRIMSVSFSE